MLFDALSCKFASVLRPPVCQGASEPSAIHLCTSTCRAAYFARLRTALDRSHFQVLDDFEGDGLYLHKRPVRGAGGAAFLAHGGTVFHHVVLYVKRGDEVHTCAWAASCAGIHDTLIGGTRA